MKLTPKENVSAHKVKKDNKSKSDKTPKYVDVNELHKEMGVDKYSREEVLDMVYKEKRTHKRNPYLEEKILSYLADGYTKKASAEAAGINESTLYHWINNDDVFKHRVENALGGKIRLLAIDNISEAVKEGDLDASKYILNKTRHFERRYGDGKSDDSKLLSKNPSTGVFEIREPEDIASALLGDTSIETIGEGEFDELEQLLYQQEEMSQKGIQIAKDGGVDEKIQIAKEDETAKDIEQDN